MNPVGFVFELQPNTPNRGHATAFESVSFQICSDLCHHGCMTDEEQSEAKLTREERSFAAEVRRLREENSWSQADLSDLLKKQGLTYVNKTMVSRIENATRPVRMIEAQALSRIFRRTVSAMTNPDGREYLLTQIDRNHSRGRKAFVAFKDATEAFVRLQTAAGEDLSLIARDFRDRDSFDAEAQHTIEHLDRNLRTLTEIDPSVVAAEIVEAEEHRRGKHPEAS